MSILGKYTLEEKNKTGEQTYVTPAVVRRDDEPISLKNSCIISMLLHPTVLGISWLVSVILLYFGIIQPLFDRPSPKVKDIEFVLTDREETPINKNTPYRSDMNSRAGGKHDPNRKVSMPSPPSGTQQAVSTPASAQKSTPQAVEKKTEQPKQKEQKTQSAQKPAVSQASQETKPQPPTVRPSIKPPMTPKVTSKPAAPFQVTVPSGGTTSGQYTTGPISGSGTSANNGNSSAGTKGSGGGFTPSPMLAPTGGGSSGGSKLAKGGGTGGGNPGPGNPNGRPGIDAIREPDFGPYMRELQRRIKMNWDPPKGDESKRVVLLFKIAKDGRLLSCSIYKSSGLPSADKAALHAVQVSAPFKPLPPDFRGSSIDIQFTFDYNVFGASGYQ